MTKENDFWYRPPEAVEDPDTATIEKAVVSGENTDLLKDGLPWQAFAVVGDRSDPDTWFLPHHTKAVKKAVKGKIGYEHTVDWKAMPRMVYLLSRFGRMEAKLPLDPEQVLQAATHLAVHYIKAKKPVPDALAAISYMGK
jgi:hypothetical protein